MWWDHFPPSRIKRSRQWCVRNTKYFWYMCRIWLFLSGFQLCGIIYLAMYYIRARIAIMHKDRHTIDHHTYTWMLTHPYISWYPKIMYTHTCFECSYYYSAYSEGYFRHTSSNICRYLHASCAFSMRWGALTVINCSWSTLCPTCKWLKNKLNVDAACTYKHRSNWRFVILHLWDKYTPMLIAHSMPSETQYYVKIFAHPLKPSFIPPMHCRVRN